MTDTYSAEKPAFDPSQPFEAGSKPPFDPSKPFEAAGKKEGGAFTDIIPEVGTAIKDALKGTYEGLFSRPLARAQKAATEPISFTGSLQRAGEDIADLGKGTLSALSIPISPIVGAARSLIGHPMADVVTALNPPGQGMSYEDAKGKTDLALSGLGARGGGIPRGGVPNAAKIAEAQANEKLAGDVGIRLSRGQAAGDLEGIRYEDMASRGAYGKPAQDVAAPFFEGQFQDIQTAGRGVGEQVARGAGVAENPSEAAATLNAELLANAERARAGTGAVEQGAAREAELSRGALDTHGRILGDIVSEGRPTIENPRQAGEVVSQEVRSQAARDRADYQQRYNEAFSLPGEFHAGAFEGVGNRIQGRMTLGDNPVIIDDVTTPIASRAVRDLDNISSLKIQNRADPRGQPNPENITAVDLRGVDQARKRLVSFYKAARSGQNAADVRATGRLIEEFDTSIEQAITNGLFSGDDRALQALQDARAAYSAYARTYRPRQAGDDVGTAIRRIVDRNATAEETANMIVGSGRIGNSGTPVRLAERLEQIFGRDSDAWSTVRQAIWQRASQARNAEGAVDPGRAATGILDLANSSLGRRVFNAAELAAMRTHAQGIRGLEASIEALPRNRGAQAARTAYEDIFGGADIGGAQGAVFRRIIDGTATAEETANAVFGTIGSGNPGNTARLIQSIERIVGPDSEAMAAIRQGVWQKLTQSAAGKDQPGQQKLVQAINEFLNGRGQSIARSLYTQEELDMMRRYANAVKLTVIPKYARTNSDTTPALLAAINKYGGAVLSALGFAADHSLTGGLAGFGTSTLLKKGAGMVAERNSVKKISRQFEPTPNAPITLPPSRTQIGIGLSAPGRVPIPALPSFPTLQSVGIGRADQNEPQVPRP